MTTQLEPARPTRRHRREISGPFTSTVALLRATLKFDGRKFAPWVAITALLSVSSVIAYPLVFPSVADRTEFATVIGANPALGLIFGPAYDLSTVDGFNAWRSLALGGFFTALGTIFAVTRAVREQEDSGQAELLASSVLGRGSRLMAGIGLATIGSLAVGLVSAALTIVFGGGWAASLTLGGSFVATGLLFTGVSAICSQLASDSRTANSLAMSVLGVLFVLRGVTYSMSTPTWMRNINPLSWVLESKPAVANNWGQFVPVLVLTAMLLIIAFMLQTRRDFGQGVIAPRTGAARGNLRTPWQLALRLNRTSLLTWLIVAALIGCVFGFFAGSIKEILADNPTMAQIFASGKVSPDDLIGEFAATILSMTGIILSVPGVLTVLNLHSEENKDRLEPVLVAYGSRPKYFLAHVALAWLATAVFMLVAGSVMATIMARSNIGVSFIDVLAQAALTIPALWLIVGISAVVVGARPHVIIAAWAGVLMSFALTILGPSFKLWDWVLSISPFRHVPPILSGNEQWLGICIVLLIAVVFAAVGTAGFTRRDIAKA